MILDADGKPLIFSKGLKGALEREIEAQMASIKRRLNTAMFPSPLLVDEYGKPLVKR